jgi:hypothetical protein
MTQENWKFLLIDRNNDGILCLCSNRRVGQNLSLGMLDTKVIELPLHRYKFREFLGVDFDKKLLKVSGKREIRPLSESELSERYLARRNEARIREKYLELLEMMSFLSRRKKFLPYPDEIYSILNDEIRASNPSQRQYSEGIVEYAEIQDIPVESAFYEIQFKLESYKTVMIRDYALFEKYVRIFTTCDLGEMEKNFRCLQDEMFLNAKV